MSHPTRRFAKLPDDPVGPDVALLFAIAAAMAHGGEALDRERAEHPDESVSALLRRVRPNLCIHAERIARAYAELEGAPW